MGNRQGVQIEAVSPESAAHKAGLREKDTLLALNGHPIRDAIDYLFFKDCAEMRLLVGRKGKKHEFSLALKEGELPGIELGQFKVKTCNNRCVFCFVSQLPKGLRKTLYVKDEDYRMSFLHGNYVTLSNLSSEDRKRIAGQRLSPLYVSVHSTDRALRSRMLGNPKAPDIMKELSFLRDNKIAVHAQVVLCPGLNDGRHLAGTIKDLYSFHPYLQSVAVVPVGLTAHRKTPLKPVEIQDAERAIEVVESFRKRFRKKHGDPIVYASDEMYIKAGRPFPPIGDYGDLPQIENGVGMVPLFVHRARKIRLPEKKIKTRFLTFTGTSFYPYLARLAARLERQGVDIEAAPVENSFFGASVTVAGLLTGRDVLRSLQEKADDHDTLLIPDVVLREGGDMFLDDIKVGDIESALGIRTTVVPSTPEGLCRAIASA